MYDQRLEERIVAAAGKHLGHDLLITSDRNDNVVGLECNTCDQMVIDLEHEQELVNANDFLLATVH